MRLIDADKLLENITTDWLTDQVVQDDVVNRIINMPTVDAEHVIRCKDCKHWDGYFCHNKWWGDGYGNYTPPIKTEDGFCDWAERKEE